MITERDSQVSWSASTLAAELGATLVYPGHGSSAADAANCAQSRDPSIRAVHQDSRRAETGSLFVARVGEHVDGWNYASAAVDRGAVAVLTAVFPDDTGHAAYRLPAHVPVLRVSDVREAIARASQLVYGDPTSRLQVVGITGTNGKTTTSYMTRVALDAAGARTAVLGTLGASFREHRFPGVHTTPEADDVMRVAASMVDHGASHLVMEVSSHALVQHRADGVRYSVAAFTNLTQDHLDYHETMQAYAAAKDRLFFELAPRRTVIVVDDPHGRELAHQLQKRGTWCLSVATDSETDALIRPASQPVFHARGVSCDVHTPGGVVALEAPFIGKHNLANLMTTIAIVHALDLPMEPAIRALRTAPAVPGRLERCDEASDDIVVLVDYAHTPDALERALVTIRQVTDARVVCVFGCGGDRDRAKRPLMGNVVGAHADLAIVTNDNPRTEDPAAIADAITQGMKGARASWHVQLDREAAIEEAIATARPGDVVLIAGKGHEPYQLIGDVVHAFDDRKKAREALGRRRNRAGGQAPWQR